MNEVKQVIVMRTDLNMRKGKMIAQGAHASIAFITHRMEDSFLLRAFPNAKLIELSKDERAWIDGRFTKICVRVDSEDELYGIYNMARNANLTAHLIKDAGLTEFKEPTNTCVAIGPNKSEDIDKITGHLKLL